MRLVLAVAAAAWGALACGGGTGAPSVHTRFEDVAIGAQAVVEGRVELTLPEEGAQGVVTPSWLLETDTHARIRLQFAASTPDITSYPSVVFRVAGKRVAVDALEVRSLDDLHALPDPEAKLQDEGEQDQPLSTASIYFPWNATTVRWNFPDHIGTTVVGYYNYDELVRPVASPATQGRAYLMQFQYVSFSDGVHPGYVGIQEMGVRPGLTPGRNAIFTIWDAVSAAGQCQKITYNGPAVRCTIAYPWVAGNLYRFRIWQLAETTWGAWVQGPSGDKWIGSIRMPDIYKGHGLDKFVYSITQAFGTPPATCAGIKFSQVRFREPTANNGSARYTWGDLHYDTEGGGCTNRKMGLEGEKPNRVVIHEVGTP